MQTHVDGLTPVEREILTVVERAGPNGQLFKSPPIHTLCEKHGMRAVQEALRSLMSAQRVCVTTTATQGHLLTIPRAQITDGTHVVYSLIENAGSHGIDTVTICQRAKISRTEVLKCISTLMQNSSIKETRHYANPAQKIYMLSTLEPSERVTGGSFFTNRVLDQDFIVRAREIIHSRLKVQEVLRVSEMKVALDGDPQIAQRHLSMKEVAILARSLELDDFIRKVNPGSGIVPSTGAKKSVLFHDFSDIAFCLSSRSNAALSRDEWPPIEMAWAAAVPCAGCQLANECDVRFKKALINPTTCKYLGAWISKVVPNSSNNQQQQNSNNNSNINQSLTAANLASLNQKRDPTGQVPPNTAAASLRS